MKNLSINYRRTIPTEVIALVLGCFAFSPAAKADPPIAGLWHEHYTSQVGGPPFETYAQWHSDGLEIETPNFTPGVCMGTWEHTEGRTVKLFHVGWTPGSIPGAPQSVQVRVEAPEYGAASTAPMIRSSSTRMETSSPRTGARSTQRAFR